MSRAVAKSTVGLLAMQAVGVVLSYGVTVALAQLLGPEQFGLYSFVVALSLALAVPTQAGLPLLIVREVAAAKAARSWASVKGLLSWADSMVVAISAALLAGAIFLFAIVPGARGPADLASLLLGLAIVPLTGLATVRSAHIRGLSFVLLSQFSERIVRQVALLGLLLAAAIAGRLAGASDALLVTLAAVTVSLLTAVLIQRRVRDPAHKEIAPVFHRKQWWSAAIPFGLSTGADVLNATVGLILLGYFAGPESVGVYRIGAQFALLAGFTYTAANYVLLPRFSQAFNGERPRALQRTASSAAAASLLAAIALFLLFILFGPWLLAMLFGADYLVAYVPTLILMGAQAASALFGFGAGMLNMSGNERQVTQVFLIGLAVNVALSALLIQGFGAAGAALGWLVTALLVNGWLWIASKRRLGIDSAAWRALAQLGRAPVGERRA